jgi:hypothetical protein
VLWRDPSEAGDLSSVEELRTSRNNDRQRPPLPQPGPYFVLDTKHLRIICIDTGILDTLDEQQGRWLLNVSQANKPKILLTGKPLIVNGHTNPCAIDGAPDGFRTVLDLVRAPEFNYRLTLGGDTHNYQHYIDHLEGIELHHVVSGGGGAFMHATHTIPRIRRNTAAEGEPSARIFFGANDPEDEFKCYPLRRDSMAAYSRVLQSKLDKLTGRRDCDKPLINLTLTDDEAGSYLKRTTRLTRQATARSSRYHLTAGSGRSGGSSTGSAVRRSSTESSRHSSTGMTRPSTRTLSDAISAQMAPRYVASA